MNEKQREKTIIAIKKYGYIALAVLLAAASVWAITASNKAAKMEQQVNNSYDRGYIELLSDLENLLTSLSKLQVISTDKQYILQLMDIWRQTGQTKGVLASLPVSQVVMGDLSAFVTRMGDYCYMLGQKVASGSVVDQSDLDQIGDLEQVCIDVYNKLSDEFETNRGKYAELSTEGYLQMADEDDVMFAQLAEDSTDYPHLIYDGPYSETRDEQTAKYIAGESEVTEDEAKKAAADFLGEDYQGDLVKMDDLNGTIECYVFKGETEEQVGDVSIYITKKGAKVLMMTEEILPSETVVPDEEQLNELETVGAEYLKDHGYGEVEATYSQYYDGLAVINFAATQDGVVLYPDLIKLSLEISSKEVVGVDARNYIMAHQDRTLRSVNLSIDEARAILNPSLNVVGERIALIPEDDLTECLCYEFTIEKDGTDYLVYIDALNGEEVDILRIIHTNQGSLVM